MNPLQQELRTHPHPVVDVLSGINLRRIANMLRLQKPFIMEKVEAEQSEHDVMQILQSWQQASSVILWRDDWVLLEEMFEEHDIDYATKPHFIVNPNRLMRTLREDPYLILGGSAPNLLELIGNLTGVTVSPLCLLDPEFYIYYQPETKKLITSHHVAPPTISHP